MKSLIEELNEIPEMYNLRHMHDNMSNDGFNYTEDLLKNSITPVLFKNPNMNSFLEKLNKMTVSMIESILPVRNIFYWSHNKYFNGHGK